MASRADTMTALLRATHRHFKRAGRGHLPWRRTRNPYFILVSEIMLQQTQVDRTLPFYERFITRFPSVLALANADMDAVLQAWQGLGYNRRAKSLRDAARTVVAQYGGKMPREVSVLESLPGIGPYTARAVAVFAFNAPEIFIETNIRTVFLSYFFIRSRRTISDKEIMPLIELALSRSRMEPREFYAALMDWGSYLKKTGSRLNSKSTHYAKQSKFEGSRRQLRGQLITLLLQKTHSMASLIRSTGRTPKEVREELSRLQKENFIAVRGKQIAIAK